MTTDFLQDPFDLVLVHHLEQQALGAVVVAGHRSGGGDAVGELDQHLLDQLGGDGAEIGHCLRQLRSEEHTSELQSLMRISYAVFCLKKKTPIKYKQMYTYSTHTNQIKLNTHT